MAQYFSKVLSGTTRPVATTLSAQKLSGATTATLTAATGWDDSTPVHGIMYRTDAGTGAKVAGSQIDWKATLSGTTLSNFTVTAGTDDTYAIGTTVELAPTAAWGDDMATGILVEHNQDGTHGAVTATSVTATGAVQGSSVISTGDIQHRSISLETIRSESVFDFVASGCVWSGDAYGSTRAASMTSGIVYIGGKRVAVSAVTARTFTASKDTYVDVDNTGALTYTEVANNAASPALAASNIRLGIIITAAGSIADAGSVNQGEYTKVLPIASSTPYAVTDSLGNLICPRDSSRRLLGYRRITSDFTSTTTGSYADVTALSVPVIVPSSSRKIRVTVCGYYMSTSAAAGTNVELVCTNATAGAVIGGVLVNNYTASGAMSPNFTASDAPSSGSNSYKVQFKTSAAGTFTLKAISTVPAFIMVELV